MFDSVDIEHPVTAPVQDPPETESSTTTSTDLPATVPEEEADDSDVEIVVNKNQNKIPLERLNTSYLLEGSQDLQFAPVAPAFAS